MRKGARMLLLVISLLLVAWSVYRGTGLAREYIKGRDSYQAASEDYTHEQVENGTISEKRKEKRKAPISVDFQELQEKNPDVIGWIYIESIDLSYPVLQGMDNEYYLSHTWDRQEVFAASIFADYRNYPDFQDFNTIIYGHNMKDGSMFHDIQFCMEEKYYEKSPYIWVLTPQENYQYEIFTEYDTRYDSDTYTLFDGPGEEFSEWIGKMQGQSLWKTDVSLTGTERILTLSTCNKHEVRRVVQAKRLE